MAAVPDLARFGRQLRAAARGLAPDGLGHDYWHTGSASFTGTVNASFSGVFSVIADQVRYNMYFQPTLTDTPIGRS